MALNNTTLKIKKKTVNNLKTVDFFCGAGGVTRGFIDAGIKVLGGIDFDINCKDTYEKNNEGVIFLHKDISKYTPKNLQKDLRIKKNDDNLIFVGCSPCQYYSTVNNVKDKSAKGKLLLEEFQRFVEYFKPGYLFIENVPGLKKDHKSPLGKFQQFLIDNGYTFSEDVLNAKYLGVPQNRKRYVMLATRLFSNIDLPRPKGEKIFTVKDAIGNSEIFPIIPAGHKDTSDFLHNTAKLEAINLKRIKLTKPNGGSRTDWPKELQLKCYENYDGHGDVYGRLYWSKPSPTITTKFYSISNGRYGHPEQHRGLSLREGAILQSFGIDYKFCAKGQGNIARLIGNAVPPKMAEAIGKAIIANRLNGTV